MAFGKKTYTFNAQIRKIVIQTFANNLKGLSLQIKKSWK
jgi:hypothetical protein